MDSLPSSLPKQNTRQKQGNPEVGRRALRANENGTHVFYNQSRSQSGQGERELQVLGVQAGEGWDTAKES